MRHINTSIKFINTITAHELVKPPPLLIPSSNKSLPFLPLHNLPLNPIIPPSLAAAPLHENRLRLELTGVEIITAIRSINDLLPRKRTPYPIIIAKHHTIPSIDAVIQVQQHGEDEGSGVAVVD